MRKSIILFLFALMAISIVGCEDKNILSLEENGIKEITISNFKYFGQISDDIIVTVKDTDEIDEIARIMKSSIKLEGILDVAGMHYDINIIYMDKSTKGFHIYLGETDGLILDVENTGQGYKLTEGSVQILQGIIGR